MASRLPFGREEEGLRLTHCNSHQAALSKGFLWRFLKRGKIQLGILAGDTAGDLALFSYEKIMGISPWTPWESPSLMGRLSRIND